MTIREIITVPHETLRKKARRVTDFGSDLQKLIDDMVETMRHAPGVGLAAPQVDVPLQVIVVEFAEEKEETHLPPKLYVVVNPEIVRFSRETEPGVEGCLSVPGYLGEVERFSKVTVQGLNRNGTPIRIKAEGWLARIFQHEIDHLKGVLFTDRTERVWEAEAGAYQAVSAD